MAYRLNVYFLYIFTFLCFMLNGCTHLTSPPASQPQSSAQRKLLLEQLNQWQLKGKIAIITPNDSGSASLTWTQQQQNFSISLFGPLGLNGLQLTGQRGLVMVQTANGQQYTASSPEQLLRQQWGWDLPVSYLTYWIRGLAIPNLPKQASWDTLKRLNQLEQAGFVIRFLNYTRVQLINHEFIDLPNKISIDSATFHTKIMIYEWKLG